MDENQFWSIIGSGGPPAQDHADRHLAAVRARLMVLPADDVLAFQRRLPRLAVLYLR